MRLEKSLTRKIIRDALISIFLYALPVLLMLLSFYVSNKRPWENYHAPVQTQEAKNFVAQIFQNLNGWGLTVLALIVGAVEFAYGLYANKWSKNERTLDIVCFVIPKLVVRPFVTYVGLLYLPALFPNGENMFAWVPFWWGFFIIAVADDLTQYSNLFNYCTCVSRSWLCCFVCNRD